MIVVEVSVCASVVAQKNDQRVIGDSPFAQMINHATNRLIQLLDGRVVLSFTGVRIFFGESRRRLQRTMRRVVPEVDEPRLVRRAEFVDHFEGLVGDEISQMAGHFRRLCIGGLQPWIEIGRPLLLAAKIPLGQVPVPVVEASFRGREPRGRIAHVPFANVIGGVTRARKNLRHRLDVGRNPLPQRPKPQVRRVDTGKQPRPSG